MAEAIVVEDLHKRFGEVVALDGIDFTVPPGTVFGLLGPNGAGKTTAVRVLTTLLVPDAGSASVLDIDVVRGAEEVRRLIGLAGQYAAVDENLTGRENLRLVGRLSHMAGERVRRRADELLGRFDLLDAADRVVRTYSGGMRRRLDLAAALVHRPPVLFLDEPTTGLDPRSRADLWQVIEDLVAEGTTLLLTTQYLEEADRLADRIAVVDGGRIIAAGTSDELKDQLGSTLVEVTVCDAATAERAVAALGRLGPAEVTANRVVSLKVDDGPRALPAVVRLLDAEGIDLDELAVREPTLDDVFLTLTGRRTAEEAA